MARKLRIDVGEQIYHVINRSNQRKKIFKTGKDYQRFIDVLREGATFLHMRILSFCIMPNHWHLVLWPKKHGDLSRFMHWITVTHTRRYHVRKGSIGSGHVYQGRYKAHLISTDSYFLTVCRYVERNALTGHLVERAEQWPWSSLAYRRSIRYIESILSTWPIDTPENWEEWVNTPLTKKEIQGIQKSIRTQTPYATKAWMEQNDFMVTLKPRGRPRSKNRT